MNTLREALEGYLTMRRGLGFKLYLDAKRLFDFVSFLEERGATYITTSLCAFGAAAWNKQADMSPGRSIPIRSEL